MDCRRRHGMSLLFEDALHLIRLEEIAAPYHLVTASRHPSSIVLVNINR